MRLQKGRRMSTQEDGEQHVSLFPLYEKGMTLRQYTVPAAIYAAQLGVMYALQRAPACWGSVLLLFLSLAASGGAMIAYCRRLKLRARRKQK